MLNERDLAFAISILIRDVVKDHSCRGDDFRSFVAGCIGESNHVLVHATSHGRVREDSSPQVNFPILPSISRQGDLRVRLPRRQDDPAAAPPRRRGERGEQRQQQLRAKDAVAGGMRLSGAGEKSLDRLQLRFAFLRSCCKIFPT